jgi:hypothetical protein
MGVKKGWPRITDNEKHETGTGMIAFAGGKGKKRRCGG